MNYKIERKQKENTLKWLANACGSWCTSSLFFAKEESPTLSSINLTLPLILILAQTLHFLVLISSLKENISSLTWLLASVVGQIYDLFLSLFSPPSQTLEGCSEMELCCV